MDEKGLRFVLGFKYSGKLLKTLQLYNPLSLHIGCTYGYQFWSSHSQKESAVELEELQSKLVRVIRWVFSV